MTAISWPPQCSVKERRNTVITSGHPLGLDIGSRRNSPSSTCKSRCSGMINTWLGRMISRSVISSSRHVCVARQNLVEMGRDGSQVIHDDDRNTHIGGQMTK